MKKEYDFSKMKKVGKGPVLDPKATKVQINIRVDGDILQWATAEADKRGLGYQTFLNMKMREAMLGQIDYSAVDKRLARLEKAVFKKKGA